jgi:hypothetical protein
VDISKSVFCVAPPTSAAFIGEELAEVGGATLGDPRH